jgi:NDP-sugar pyrophosphorylase family protein
MSAHEQSAELPPVCILAGGLGTRLGGLAAEIPKALMPVAGEPFVFHQLRELARQGCSRIVLCVGHLGEQIESAVGSNRFGLDVAYSYDAPGLDGTLGAIRRAAPLLGREFFVLYGDTLLVIDYHNARRQWIERGTPAFMSVLKNDGQWDASNAHYSAETGLVLAYDKFRPTPEMRWIDYGLSGLSMSSLDRCPGASDLADLWHVLAAEGALCGIEVSERFYEIGNPAALAETREFLEHRSHGAAR